MIIGLTLVLFAMGLPIVVAHRLCRPYDREE